MNRKIVAAVALAALLPALQGCVTAAAVGAGTVAVMANDRRTAGVYIEDENIEWKVLAKAMGEFRGSHINATSYNRKVLLTGEVSTEETRKAVEAAVKAVPEVREVANELAVSGNASFGSIGSDSIVTSNVKARMVGNGRFSPGHVKVVTESGTVYLMGLVTRAEGEAAVDVARSTSGVQRVVKVFEYIEAR